MFIDKYRVEGTDMLNNMVIYPQKSNFAKFQANFSISFSNL